MSSRIVIDLFSRYSSALGFAAANILPRVGVLTNLQGFARYLDRGHDFEDVQFLVETKEAQACIRFSALHFIREGDYDLSHDLLAPPMFMSFSREKDLIKTKVNGSDNEVIERWGTRPWQIKLQGILIDIKERTYPDKCVRKLYEFFSLDAPIEVTGVQFEDKGIRTICFEEIEFSPVEGFADTVQFALSALSLSEVDFTLENP